MHPLIKFHHTVSKDRGKAPKAPGSNPTEGVWGKCWPAKAQPMPTPTLSDSDHQLAILACSVPQPGSKKVLHQAEKIINTAFSPCMQEDILLVTAVGTKEDWRAA